MTIQIWHTTDDLCGPPCAKVQSFMADVIEMASFLEPADPITVEPHYVFVNCTDPGTGASARRGVVPVLFVSTPTHRCNKSDIFCLWLASSRHSFCVELVCVVTTK